MKYYYQMLRFHLANKHHIYTRNTLDKTWKRLCEERRKLRVIENELLEKKSKRSNCETKDTNIQSSS